MEEFFENFYGILEDTEKNEINKNNYELKQYQYQHQSYRVM